ncbi:MAG TPA: hypothetical protein VNA27_10195 [Rubrobacteraceae bacterium]|nr:hypothetical protein [Rubrobacteraceae bacterium]
MSVKRVVPGEAPRTENLCEIHVAEVGVGGSRSPCGGGGLFDEFFGRFFDDERATMTGPFWVPAEPSFAGGGRNR